MLHQINMMLFLTVECNEGRVSDTEELLGRNPEYQTSCTTPPLQNQSTHSPSPLPNIDQQNPQQQQTQHHLNLQVINYLLAVCSFFNSNW